MAVPRVPKSERFTITPTPRSPTITPQKKSCETSKDNFRKRSAQLREAAEAPAQNLEAAIHQQATALLDGGVAVASLPDVAQLRRQVDVLAEAVRLQKNATEAERVKVAREVTAEAIPAHREAIASFVRLQREALDGYERILAIRAEANRQSDGVSFLPEFGMNPVMLSQFRYRFGEFVSFVREYIA